MSWRIWRNRLPLRGVLRPSIPDNNDYQRRFRGMGRFPALCGHETDCRFAGFTSKHSGQRRLSATLSRDGRISRAVRTWNGLPLREVLRSSIPDNGDWPRRFRGMGEFPASRGRETGCRFAGFYVQAFRTTAIVRDAFAGWTDFPRRADVKQAAASRGFTSKHSGQRRFRGMDGFSFPRGRYVQAFRTTIRLLRSVCTVRRTFRRRCGAGFSYL